MYPKDVKCGNVHCIQLALDNESGVPFWTRWTIYCRKGGEFNLLSRLSGFEGLRSFQLVITCIWWSCVLEGAETREVIRSKGSRNENKNKVWQTNDIFSGRHFLLNCRQAICIFIISYGQQYGWCRPVPWRGPEIKHWRLTKARPVVPLQNLLIASKHPCSSWSFIPDCCSIEQLDAGFSDPRLLCQLESRLLQLRFSSFCNGALLPNFAVLQQLGWHCTFKFVRLAVFFASWSKRLKVRNDVERYDVKSWSYWIHIPICQTSCSFSRTTKQGELSCCNPRRFFTWHWFEFLSTQIISHIFHRIDRENILTLDKAINIMNIYKCNILHL